MITRTVDIELIEYHLILKSQSYFHWHFTPLFIGMFKHPSRTYSTQPVGSQSQKLYCHYTQRKWYVKCHTTTETAESAVVILEHICI